MVLVVLLVVAVIAVVVAIAARIEARCGLVLVIVKCIVDLSSSSRVVVVVFIPHAADVQKSA